MRKFGSVAVWLALATPAFAEAPAKERQVWITIGTDALEPARASFRAQGLTLPAVAVEKAGVAALRVRESHLEKLSEAMHDKLNRCAGFIAHDSEQAARTAVEGTLSMQAVETQAVSYSLNNAASVNAMLSGVQELNIRNTINSLSTNWTSRRYNLQSGTDAANWLKTQWTTIANGRTDVTVSLFTHASTTSPQPSVIATIQGTTLPNEVVVIGGHLDSINSSGSTYAAPGADDDASGVASVTEIFRVAMANGYKPARTVKFMAYAAEEVGLKGSADIANWHKNNAVNVVGVLQLDMTNYKGSTYDFAMVTDNTNAAQNTFVTNLITTYLSGLTYTNITCGYGCSDHASWTTAGFASSMPFEAPMNSSNPNIHTANDTLSVTSGNANNSVKFAKLGAAFLGELAKGATTGNTPPPTDGGGTPPPSCPTLSNGVAVTGISVATGTWSCAYTLSVPAGQSSLKIDMSGGTGDGDMYVKFGAEPTTSAYDCRPYQSGNTESCSFTNPAAGTWYVKIYGYSAVSGTSLKGTYAATASGSTLTNGVATAAYSGATGSWKCWTLSVPTGKTSVVFNQAGLSGTTGDADLYVRYNAQPTTSSYNCRPYQSGSTESCTLSNPSAGTWYACSYGYSAYSNVTMKGTY